MTDVEVDEIDGTFYILTSDALCSTDIPSHRSVPAAPHLMRCGFFFSPQPAGRLGRNTNRQRICHRLAAVPNRGMQNKETAKAPRRSAAAHGATARSAPAFLLGILLVTFASRRIGVAGCLSVETQNRMTTPQTQSIITCSRCVAFQRYRSASSGLLMLFP